MKEREPWKVTCPICGKEFTTTNQRRVYCESAACKEQGNKEAIMRNYFERRQQADDDKN